MHPKTNRHLQAKIRARQARRRTMCFTNGVRAYVAMITIVGLLFTMLPEAFAISSWNPTLLVNTEAFQTIDDDDTASDLELRFGDTLQEKIVYDRSDQRFRFTRGVYVSGNGIFTGSVLVNIGNSAAGADTALEVIGVMSGTTVYATKSFSGAGLTDCDTAGTSKLLWDSTTGRFSCGSDQTGGGAGSAWSNTGSLQGYFDNRFVNQSGDTMTGTLTVNVTGGNNSTIGVNVLNTLSGSYIHAEKSLSTSGTLTVTGVSRFLSTSRFDGNAAYTTTVGIGKTGTPNAKLEVVGIASGTTVYATKSFSGAGLSDCDTGASSKLLWDATTGRFSCGTDQTGGASTTLSGTTLRVSGPAAVHGVLTATGNVITDGDIIINDDLTAAGDATLTFGNATTSQTLKFVHSLQKFSFSAPVRVLGNLSGSSLTIDRNGTFSGTLLAKGNISTKGTLSGQTLTVMNNSTSYVLGNLSVGKTSVNNGVKFEVNGVMSGRTLRTSNGAGHSGTLAVEGTLTGAVLQGFGLTDCDTAATSKLLYDVTTGKFSCGTDQGGGAGAGLTRINGASGAAGADMTWQNLASNSSDCTTTALCSAVMTTTGVGVGTWKFKYTVIYQTAATTTGIAFGINHTGTAGQFQAMWTHMTTGGAAATGIGDNDTATSAGQLAEGKHDNGLNAVIGSATAGVATANADIMAVIEGIIVVTVSGNLELKIGSEVAASAVRVMADSTLELIKVE